MLYQLRNASGSSIERADKCPASHYLPQDHIENVYGVRGHGVHDFIVRWRDYLDRDRDAALAEVADDAPHRSLCEAIPLDSIPEGGKLEVAFAYDARTRTARIIGYNIGRAYREHGALPHEICGTADLVGTAGGCVVIIDWKSGFKFVAKWQLRFLALAACRAMGVNSAKVCNWYLREDGTILEDAQSVDTFDAIDLDNIEDELVGVLERLERSHERALAGERPRVSGGSWCQYCQSKAHCDLTTGVAKRALSMKLDQPMTPERAMEAWMLFDLLEGIIKAGRAGLREYGRTQPFPDGQGYTVKQIEASGLKILPDKAEAVLRRKFGDAVADAARESTISQASIERALKAHRPGPLAPAKREALKAMRQGGAAFDTTHLEVKKVRDKTAVMATLQLDAAGTVTPLLLGSG